MKKKKYDYGECVICNSQMKEKRVKQDFWIKGELIVIENVPAGVCPQCGEKVVKADIGIQIASIIKDSERISKAAKISVPAIKFAEKKAAA
ncbi:MAG: YgiT-type zinc finger protein [Deltaproteobacteria bacterium]|nr:YgiT-type zinc finger protein [Deltaproteobacteria bacterium]